jgi:hypothetical protein
MRVNIFTKIQLASNEIFAKGKLKRPSFVSFRGSSFILFSLFLAIILLALNFSCRRHQPEETFSLSLDTLLDKIKGGWVGQLIGCAFAAPYEHKFQSRIIPEAQPLHWSPNDLPSLLEKSPEIFDDLFVDLLFLDTLDKKGLNTQTKELARALSRAQFALKHGLQMARHNILIGLKPPRSGHWLHNPHADDNDFQKAADFIGLISPGLVAPTIKFARRWGEIMASGDGLYGGIYIACLYSLAFIHERPETLIEEALKVLPAKASFTRTISEVLENYRRFPENWQQTWQIIEKKWGEDIGCPEGVFKPLNCDAKINAAWITIGLLYGRGDFARTITITTRCGDDTDSNAAASGGIVGTLLGFKRIPAEWLQGLKEVEKFSPRGLDISFEEAPSISLKLALENIKKNGGQINGKKISFPLKKNIPPLPLEINFLDHFPRERRELNLRLSEITSETTIEFEGTGFAINGRIIKKVPEDHTYRVAMVIDGRLAGASILPAHPFLQNPTPFFHYKLRPGKHRLFLQIGEPSPKADIELKEIIIYDKKPAK